MIKQEIPALNLSCFFVLLTSGYITGVRVVKRLNRVTRFELEATPPYNFELTVHKPLGYHWLVPSETYSNGTIWTAIDLRQHTPVGLRLRALGDIERPRVSVQVFSENALTNEEETRLEKVVTKCCELKMDISEFYALVEEDLILVHAKSDLYGMRRGRHQHLFHDLVRAITMQNAPLRRTKQMSKLLFETYGHKISFNSHAVTTWFTPDQIAQARTKELRERCKLGFRASYLRGVATAIRDGRCPTINKLETMNVEKAKEELMKLRGIGEYSAEIALPHTETFPVDVWSAKIFWKLFFPHKPQPTLRVIIEKVKEHAEERWQKWRRYAFTYVINSLDSLSKKLHVKF